MIIVLYMHSNGIYLPISCGCWRELRSLDNVLTEIHNWFLAEVLDHPHGDKHQRRLVTWETSTQWQSNYCFRTHWGLFIQWDIDYLPRLLFLELHPICSELIRIWTRIRGILTVMNVMKWIQRNSQPREASLANNNIEMLQRENGNAI